MVNCQKIVTELYKKCKRIVSELQHLRSLPEGAPSCDYGAERRGGRAVRLRCGTVWGGGRAITVRNGGEQGGRAIMVRNVEGGQGCKLHSRLRRLQI